MHSKGHHLILFAYFVMSVSIHVHVHVDVIIPNISIL